LKKKLHIEDKLPQVIPRATRDFDFIIHLEPKNIDRFIQHFQVGYYWLIAATIADCRFKKLCMVYAWRPEKLSTQEGRTADRIGGIITAAL